jgi:hypothetical protein
MVDLLRRHLLPDEAHPAGIFAPEIQAPGGGRRADLIWLGCTAATGGELVGFEIKTSRADLMAELGDLTKSDPWQRYCDRWNLVLPHLSLADGLELPPTWGVLTPPSGRRTRSMTVAVKAPKLQPQDKTPALRTLATWMHWRHHNLGVQHESLQRLADQLAAERDDLKLLIPAEHGTQRRREQEIIARIVRTLGVTDDGKLGSWRDTVEVEEVIAVLKDIAASNGLRAFAHDQLASYRDQLRWLGRQITSVLAQTDTASSTEKVS